MPILLQVNSALNYGSTGRIVENIGLKAVSKGWQCYVAHGARYQNKSNLATYQITTLREEQWAVVVSRLFDRHGLSSSNATKRFISFIEEIKPDIIHLHNIHGYYLNYEILFEYLIQTEIPVVWTLHDCWAYTGHCVHFDYIGCNKWKEGCFNCPSLKSYPSSYGLDNSSNNFALKQKLFTSIGNRLTLVTVSNWLKEITSQSFFSNNHIKTIYNGVDTKSFHTISSVSLRKKYHLENRYVLIGVATAWSDSKGFYDYIHLRKLLPDNYVIILVGLAQSLDNQLPSGMIGIERTQHVSELAQLYSAADVVLSLSKQETFGMTIVEAFSCGTPAIVYNKTAVPEILTLETGIIVEPGNYKELVAAIQEVVERKGKASYSSACRRRAEEFFDNEKCFQKYIKLYNSILNSLK